MQKVCSVGRLTGILVAIYAILLIAGCGSSGSGDGDEANNDSGIESLVLTDDTGLLKALPGMDAAPGEISAQAVGDGPQDGSGPGPNGANGPGTVGPGQNNPGPGGQNGPGPVEPDPNMPRWYMSSDSEPVRNVDVQGEGDKAYVNITGSRDVTFNIDVDLDGVFGQKPGGHEAVRKAIFQFGDNGWRLVGVTPSEMSMKDNTRDTIRISEVALNKGGALVWRATSPSEYFDPADGMAAFDPEDEVTITVNTYDPLGDVVVFMHVDAFNDRGRIRRPLLDDGTNGDIAAGDGIYTGTFKVGPAQRRFNHVGIDVIAAEAFEDETSDNYRAYGWVIPYLVNGEPGQEPGNGQPGGGQSGGGQPGQGPGPNQPGEPGQGQAAL